MIIRFLTALFSLSLAGNTLCAEPKSRSEITHEIEEEVYIYAAMASNAYDERENIFPLSKVGWEKLALDGSTIQSIGEHTYTRGAGLAFDVWRKVGSNDIVIAFRGSDSKYDYVAANLTIISWQYKSAAKQVKLFLKKNPGLRLIAATGHSLGGGLAISLSLKHTVNAYAFDSSPRIFDGFMDLDLRREEQSGTSPRRIHIFESGEALESYRRFSTKFYDIIHEEYVAHYDFGNDSDGNKISLHSGYHLALKMIQNASQKSPGAAALLANAESP